MRALFILLALMTLASCQPQANKRTVKKGADTSASQPVPGPTGGSDPVDPASIEEEEDPSDGITYYDDPFEEPEVVVGDPVVNECGIIYKDFFTGQVRFKETGFVSSLDPYKFVEAEEYADNQFISRLAFPDDSYEVCIDGAEFDSTTAGVRLIKATALNVGEAIANPERENQGAYSYEYCGTLENHSDFNGMNYIQLTKDGITYIVNDINTVNTQNLDSPIKGCVYFNTAAYNNYSITFKKFIDAEAFDYE